MVNVNMPALDNLSYFEPTELPMEVIVVPFILMLLCCPFMLFLGYRIYKITLFTLGGLGTAMVTFLGCLASGNYDPSGCAGLAILMFFVGGVVMLCCYFVAIFFMGCSCAVTTVLVLVMYIAISTVDDDREEAAVYSVYSSGAFWPVFILIGILGGILAIKLQRLVIIAITAWVGAFCKTLSDCMLLNG